MAASRRWTLLNLVFCTTIYNICGEFRKSASMNFNYKQALFKIRLPRGNNCESKVHVVEYDAYEFKPRNAIQHLNKDLAQNCLGLLSRLWRQWQLIKTGKWLGFTELAVAFNRINPAIRQLFHRHFRSKTQTLEAVSVAISVLNIRPKRPKLCRQWPANGPAFWKSPLSQMSLIWVSIWYTCGKSSFLRQHDPRELFPGKPLKSYHFFLYAWGRKGSICRQVVTLHSVKGWKWAHFRDVDLLSDGRVRVQFLRAQGYFSFICAGVVCVHCLPQSSFREVSEPGNQTQDEIWQM